MGIFTKMIKAAALAVGVAALPMAAQAVTITVKDLTGADADVVIADFGTSVTAMGSFSSGVTFNITGTSFDSATDSALSSISITTAGSGKIAVVVSEDNFTGGSSAVNAANLLFRLTSSAVANTLIGRSYVDAANSLYGMTDQIGSGDISLASPAGTGAQLDSASLPGPFSMTSYFEIDHTGQGALARTSFDAIVTAAVPVPAAGLLLIGGLGGLVMVRRRRKAA